MLGNKVENAGLLCTALALGVAIDQETVYVRLDSVLIAREGIEAEVEKAPAVPVLDGAWEEEAQETAAMWRLTDTPGGSHFDLARLENLVWSLARHGVAAILYQGAGSSVAHDVCGNAGFEHVRGPAGEAAVDGRPALFS